MAVGDVDESSIIIIACRRLAPAAMGMDMSEKEAEEGGADVRPSPMKSRPTVEFVYGVASSPFAGGRGRTGR